MKFFTADNCRRFDRLTVFRATQEGYRRRLIELVHVLPQRVLELAEPHGIENGLVAKVCRDEDKGVLRIVLRCGDLCMGYYNLELTYEQASLSSSDNKALALISRTTKTQRHYEYDLFCHELDVVKTGTIEHSLIFRNREDPRRFATISITCRGLHWRRVPKLSRRLPCLEDRYPGGPVLDASN